MTHALEWTTRFRAIGAEFGFDEAADARVATDLARRLARPGYDAVRVWESARAGVSGRRVFVVGAADRALQDLARTRGDDVLIAADGATTAVLEAGRRPFAVVTDLDGAVEDQVAACRDGSLLFVHAHGDNEGAIASNWSRFQPSRVAGTCQVEPPSPLRNVGGFTDGDRAVHLALGLGASEVRLLGFDFEHGPGRYSGRFNPGTKARKLEWAKRILEELIASGAPVSFA